MHEVQDEPLFADRVAGLDIAKAMVEVTIRVPSGTTPGRRQQETRSFGTTRAELESLAGWLAGELGGDQGRDGSHGRNPGPGGHRLRRVVTDVLSGRRVCRGRVIRSRYVTACDGR
jgi:hypothetical protein